MKIAAARALAELARQQVPEEVAAAYGGARSFGPDYIIPAPFDPRLIEEVPLAVARAAMDSGVARRPILDEAAYRTELRARLNPTTAVLERKSAGWGTSGYVRVGSGGPRNIQKTKQKK